MRGPGAAIPGRCEKKFFQSRLGLGFRGLPGRV